MNKSYYAIIPANVRYDTELTANAKLLYGEITALCNEKGYCWANNYYFSELYGVSIKSVSRWINQLIEKGYIYSEMTYKKGKKEIDERRIYLGSNPKEGIDKNVQTPRQNCPEGIDKNVQTPIDKIVQDNNTSFNTTINNTVNSRKQVYDEESIYFQLADRLHQRILNNNPNAKKPNMQTWSNDMRLMMERDDRTEEQIAYLIDWVQNDSFWMSNIMSPKKLREKFDQLVLRIKAERNQTVNKVIKPPSYEVKEEKSIERRDEQNTSAIGNVQLFK